MISHELLLRKISAPLAEQTSLISFHWLIIGEMSVVPDKGVNRTKIYFEGYVSEGPLHRDDYYMNESAGV